MKNLAKRGLTLLLVLAVCISLLPALTFTADAATVNYVKDGKYVYNWGTREETATFLSPMAEDFYEANNITYEDLAALSGSATTSSVPSSALYKKLQNLMKSNHDYETSYNATKNLFQYTDCQSGGGKISSFYSGKAIGPSWNGEWNREHTWPNSKGDASGNGENDIIMLRPTSTSENSSRGNKAYGESSSFYHPNSESNGKYDLRGDVARIMLFVYCRWGNTGMWGSSGVMESKEVLLKWVEEDPVDTWELGRNDAAQSITGTRNVFVDYPELIFIMFDEAIPSDMTTPSGEAASSDYTITAVSSNTAHGTVTVSGKNITASPKAGYAVAGYTVTSGNATVTRNGNVFRVSTNSDCTIQINFAAKALCTVKFSENGTVKTTMTAYTDDAITLPVASVAVDSEYTFVGWVASAYDGTSKPASIYTAGSKWTVGANQTLYALYSSVDTSTGGGNLFAKHTGALVDGDYIITYEENDISAMTAAVSDGKRFDNTVVSPSSDQIMNPSADIVWHIESHADDTYTIYNVEAAAYAGSKNTTTRGILLNTLTDNAKWKVSVTDGTYNFTNVANNLSLRRNGTFGYGGYNTATGGPLTLYKGISGTIRYTTLTSDTPNIPDTPDVPDVPDTPATSVTLKDGDKVIIFAPAYNKALSADKVTATSYYNKGVDITVADGVVSGYSSAEVWTVIMNNDGTYSFANGGQNIALGEQFNSMTQGEIHDDWQLISLGGSLYNVKNVGRGNYLEWYADKDNWSTYNSNQAATDDQFQISFYVVGEGIVGEPTPDTPEDPCANGHSWSAATCTAPKTCSVCGTTEGSAKDHSWSAATCTAPKTCSTCGTTEGSAKDHSWSAATCTTPKTCSVCGTTEGSAKGHSWSAATCTAPKTCTTCGTTEGTALGHTEKVLPMVASTCTATGLTVGKECTVCGQTLIAQLVTPAKGHTDTNRDFTCDVCQEDLCTTHVEETIPGKAATCTETGLTEGKKCAVCGEIIVKQTMIDLLEHKRETVSGKAATCTEPGLTAGEKCSVCGTVLVAQQTISANGHNWKNATCTTPKTCTTCGATSGVANGHSWKAATCTTPKTCTICGATEGGASANTHTWAGGICTDCKLVCDHGNITDLDDGDCTTDVICPTCHMSALVANATHTPEKDDGDCTTAVKCRYCSKIATPAKNTHTPGAEATCTTAQTCIVCGMKLASAKGHTWKAATCTAPKTCSTCGATEGNAKGHNWRSATCTTPKTCTTCGTTEGTAKGHTWKAATCTTPKTCSTCGATEGTAKGHNWKSATCTTPKTCTTCGTTEGTAKGHTWKTATCTTPKTCSTCGATSGVANGHSWKAATCTTPKTCTTCGATSGVANGHSWKSATCTTPKTCTTCGATSGTANGHTWRQASCTSPRTCTTCKLTEGSALGHNWKDATCTSPMICSRCKASSGRPAGHTYDDGVDGTCNGCGIHRETTENRTVMHMFRMYDPNSGEHFYTGSTVERDNLVAVGWNYEGVGFTFSLTTGAPVYRLYDRYDTFEHLYTMDVEERDQLIADGWELEGIAFNSAYDTEVPQYRLHNPNETRGAYHFTASEEERDALIAAGWEYQGIGFYSSWK